MFVLEVGSPAMIGASFLEDAFHILHISCHGSPGALELETEDGDALPTTAAQLIDPLSAAGRPLPLVLLNSCHGGVHQGQAASFAEDLLRAGVHSVLAMQTSVTDVYATDLAREFYFSLARGEQLRPSRALALARQKLESDRLAAIRRDPKHVQQPEYATATLFVAGAEHRLADFGANKQPLKHTPRHTGSGPVPQLNLGDLVGRRNEVRTVLKTLRYPQDACAGAVLTGIGGIGKSTIAGRAIQRMMESGYLVAQHKGRVNLDVMATALTLSLLPVESANAKESVKLLLRQDLPPAIRLNVVQQVLSEQPVLLVLDDFEQNLIPGGGNFLDETAADLTRDLAACAKTGRLLITCRYPVPNLDALLTRIPVGPLSPAETRKLHLRLEGLVDVDPKILRKLGGHPRMLELLEALSRDGKGRFPHVTEKLRKLQVETDKNPPAGTTLHKDGLDELLLLGARDILLGNLLALIRTEGIEEFLLQMAVSNLAVSAPGLARMLDESGGDPAAAERALCRLCDLSLIYREEQGSALVHRWTAEGLRRSGDEAQWRERADRAGRYRWWRVANETDQLTDAVEAVRNWLAAENYDGATSVAGWSFRSLQGRGHSFSLALAAEVLEVLPESHLNFSFIADREAQAYLALGRTDRALSRRQQILARYEKLAEAEPDRADFQRDLSVSYQKIGDLYRQLGKLELARDSFLRSLELRERIVQAEPNRTEFQRGLAICYGRVGDLNRALGEMNLAHNYYLKDLTITRSLANAEVGNGEFQRDLAVSYNNVGDLYRDLGQIQPAREYYLNSLAIRQELAKSAPGRIDLQRDLAACYERIGNIYRDLGQITLARTSIENSLVIGKKLAQAEPERADLQRDLSVFFESMGGVYRALGQTDVARENLLYSLDIRRKLAQAEPDRVDFQRDLSISYNKIGDLHRDIGQGDPARDAFLKSLAIARKLAQAEPDRADFQRDLSVSLYKLAGVDQDNARKLLSDATSILQHLKDTGRLNPPDEPILRELADLLSRQE